MAEVAGYIRAIDLRFSDSVSDREPTARRARTMTFRLHRRFAPSFRFSYRGAYEPVVLRVSDLWPLCDHTTPMTGEAWAASLLKRAPSLENLQLSLPLLEALANE